MQSHQPTVSHSRYYTGLCAAVPANDIGFSMSCLLEEETEGRHICYFTQPHSVSPLSMTCQVGNCLYEDSKPLVYPTTNVVAMETVAAQMLALGIIAALILGMCLSFERLSNLVDWATAKVLQRNHQRNTQWTGNDGAGGNDEKGGLSATLLSDDTGAGGGAEGDGVKKFETDLAGAGAAEAGLVEAAGPSPILSWSNLSLWVRDSSQASRHTTPQSAPASAEPGARVSELEVERESEREFLRGVLRRVSLRADL